MKMEDELRRRVTQYSDQPVRGPFKIYAGMLSEAEKLIRQFREAHELVMKWAEASEAYNPSDDRAIDALAEISAALAAYAERHGEVKDAPAN